MAIIAILAAMLVPAVNRARKKAAINKAEAEMAALASTGGMIYLDMKGDYVDLLCNYDMADGALAYNEGVSSTPQKFDRTTATGKTFFTGFTDLAGFQDAWDGPYTTYQPNSTFQTSPANGSRATYEIDVTGWNDANDFPVGTPLDPWNHPYGLAYSIGYATAEEVMVIYSAGPDGKFQTEAGAVVVGDSDLDGSPNYATSDDLLYKFK